MRLMFRAVTIVFVSVLTLSFGGSALASPSQSNGQKAAFFTGGTGRAGWVSGTDPLAASPTGQVIQLSSPAVGGGYGGFVPHALDGLELSDVTALSYDFQVTTPGWTGGGGGSPRLVVELDNGGNLQLYPATPLTSGTWGHLDAMTGAVDTNGVGSCGYRYQASWATIQACDAGAKVTGAFLVNDSGWLASTNRLPDFTVQIGNLTLNSTVYDHPATSKK